MILMHELRIGLRFRYGRANGSPIRTWTIVGFCRFSAPDEQAHLWMGPHPMVRCGVPFATHAACKAAWRRRDLIPIGCILAGGRDPP